MVLLSVLSNILASLEPFTKVFVHKILIIQLYIMCSDWLRIRFMSAINMGMTSRNICIH